MSSSTITPRLGFTVTETVRPPKPVEPDPFIAPAGGGAAANRSAPRPVTPRAR